MQKHRTHLNSRAGIVLTRNIKVSSNRGTDRSNTIARRNAILLFTGVIAKLDNLPEDTSGLSELSQWLENGEIFLTMNGNPVKKPLQVPGYINSTETERYKNGIVLNILEGGNLYLPCNLNASLSQDAKNLLINLLQQTAVDKPVSPAHATIAPVAAAVSNVLHLHSQRPPSDSTQTNSTIENNTPTLQDQVEEIPAPMISMTTVQDRSSPIATLPPVESLIDTTDPLPENVFGKVITAIQGNSGLELINQQKGLYFISDVAMRAILAEGALYGLNNDFLTEKRIVEALPANFVQIGGFFRQYFRINISQFSIKSGNPDYDTKMLELLDLLMVGNNQLTNINGSDVKLIPYVQDELVALRNLLQSNDTELNLRRFYGAVNSGDQRQSRTITKGFFLRIPQNYQPTKEHESELDTRTDDTLYNELTSLIDQQKRLRQSISILQEKLNSIITQVSALFPDKSSESRFEEFYKDTPAQIIEELRTVVQLQGQLKFVDIPDIVARIRGDLEILLTRYSLYEQKKSEFEESRRQSNMARQELLRLQDEKSVTELQIDTEQNQLDQINARIQWYKTVLTSRIATLNKLMGAIGE